MRIRALGMVSSALAAMLAAGGACFSEHRTTGPVDASVLCAVPVDSTIFGATHALVAIRNYSFHPETLHVKAGTTVTWVNCDPASAADPHTTTSDTGDWQSLSLSPGDTHSFTFGQTGSFGYFCEPHPFMRGTVIVD